MATETDGWLKKDGPMGILKIIVGDRPQLQTDLGG